MVSLLLLSTTILFCCLCLYHCCNQRPILRSLCNCCENSKTHILKYVLSRKQLMRGKLGVCKLSHLLISHFPKIEYYALSPLRTKYGRNTLNSQCIVLSLMLVKLIRKRSNIYYLCANDS